MHDRQMLYHGATHTASYNFKFQLSPIYLFSWAAAPFCQPLSGSGDLWESRSPACSREGEPGKECVEPSRALQVSLTEEPLGLTVRCQRPESGSKMFLPGVLSSSSLLVPVVKWLGTRRGLFLTGFSQLWVLHEDSSQAPHV